MLPEDTSTNTTGRITTIDAGKRSDFSQPSVDVASEHRYTRTPEENTKERTEK